MTTQGDMEPAASEEREYTIDQALAIEHSGNVIVSAGAGSGKTAVLVERYFRLLVDEYPAWPVSSVVAITFTRKAAAELKARIIRKVLREIAREDPGTARFQRLRQLRREVGAAPIGTIHNFCGRLLREFAFDARIDPDFVILEGAQETALRLKAARETIALCAANTGDILYKDLLVILGLLSPGRLTELLSSMLADRAIFLAPARRYVESNAENLFDQLLELHSEYVRELRGQFSTRWKSVLMRLAGHATAGTVKSAAEMAISGWPENTDDNWGDIEERITCARKALLTGKDTCRVREFKQAGISDFEDIRTELESLAKEFSKANLADLDAGDLEDIERSQRLARLFLKATEVFDELRGGDMESGGQLLDFTDMELLAHNLVNSSAQVREKIRKAYPYLILDEFQDTSQVQWDILRPLVVDESGGLRQSSLFVVGDRKQGVYGFRDANVTLFSDVQRMVERSNDGLLDGPGTVSMRANFRTNPVPLALINQVFERLLRTEGNRFAVEFEPLEARKLENEGRVEYLLTDSGEDEADEEAVAADTKATPDGLTEAQLVAIHIKALVDSGEYLPGDIALLFRKRSPFAEYEEALKSLGIPVVSQQGANLFHQPELADTLAALDCMVYPHRDLKLVHYFRSPFIGFTDNLLLKIARTHGRSFYDKAMTVRQTGLYRLDDKVYKLSAYEQERLNFALQILVEARSLIGRKSPYEVVKFLLDALGVRASIQAGNRAAQAEANLQKFLMIARSAETLSFEEFLEFVHSEEQSMRGTSEAVDLTSVNAVKIMTIHAAKGLEFPVVYLPALNSGVSGLPDAVSSDGKDWMTWRLPKALVEKSSFLASYFNEQARLQQSAEERRISYVAMTRAKNVLVLSADTGKNPRSETFFQWIQEEFEAARQSGVLKTADDFPGAAETFTQNASFTGRALSRNDRIMEALHIGKQIAADLNSRTSSDEDLRSFS